MLSGAYIASENARLARKAARNGLKPYILEAEDLANIPPFPFPHIGDYRPHGWTLERQLFVDSSGLGQPGEPALTADEFLAELKIGYGYAIIEAGQFQLYVGEFKPPFAVRRVK